MGDLTHQEMLEMQREFEEMLLEPEAMSYDERQRWIEKFTTHTMAQCVSLLNELNWKHHRPYKPVEYDDLLEELVDIHKYVLAMHVVLNVDANEFAQKFRERSDEVTQRFEQEMHEQE